MKIYSAYYTHKPGGFCKRLYRLLNALARADHEIHYFTLDTPPSILSPAVRVSIIPFPIHSRSSLLFWTLFTLWCPIYLAWRMLKSKPDRICVFGAYYAGMFRLGRMLSPAPLVLFLRSLVFRIDEINDKPQSLRFFSNIVDRVGIGSASRVVCMTATMKKEIEKFFSVPLKDAPILPNDIPSSSGVREKREEASLTVFENLHDELAQDRLIVLTSGVIDRRKNLDYLLKAVEILKQRGFEKRMLVLVAGDGPLLSHYRAMASSHGLENVRFLGWCDSLDPLYPFVDIVVHPALHEGIPNSVLEALEVGLPVLCADTPEMKEMLPDPRLHFSTSDPNDLASCLISIMEKPERSLPELAKQSEEASKSLNFDWDARAVEAALAEL